MTDTTRLTLITTQTPPHESAEGWWESLGHHVSDSTGDWTHPIAEWAEIEPLLEDGMGDEDILAALEALDPGFRGGMTTEAALALVAYAREALDAAREVEGYLEAAVAAWASRDLDATIEALDAASAAEMEYGDDPATSELREQLLEDADAGVRRAAGGGQR
jgi:hypothetical protein